MPHLPHAAPNSPRPSLAISVQELAQNAADTEALTTFYTSLYEQRPDSEMAARFLLQHGLLPGGEEEALKLQKKFGKAGAGKAASTAASKSAPKRKAKDDDDDFEKPAKKKAPAKKPPAKKMAPDSSDVS